MLTIKSFSGASMLAALTCGPPERSLANRRRYILGTMWSLVPVFASVPSIAFIPGSGPYLDVPAPPTVSLGVDRLTRFVADLANVSQHAFHELRPKRIREIENHR